MHPWRVIRRGSPRADRVPDADRARHEGDDARSVVAQPAHHPVREHAQRQGRANRAVGLNRASRSRTTEKAQRATDEKHGKRGMESALNPLGLIDIEQLYIRSNIAFDSAADQGMRLTAGPNLTRAACRAVRWKLAPHPRDRAPVAQRHSSTCRRRHSGTPPYNGVSARVAARVDGGNGNCQRRRT